MKIKNIVLLSLSVAFVAMTSSCGAPKKVSANKGDVELIVPFSSAADRSDKDTFRATGIGKSPDMATAKKVAGLNARTEIASSVSVTLKAVTEQYINQVSIGDRQEYASKFEENARAVVNQQLVNSVVRGEKVFKSEEGVFTYYINIEMTKASIETAIEESITKDEKLQVAFDKYLFEKTFDAEMEKFQNK